MAWIRATMGGVQSNLDLNNPDYVSNEVTIAANGSYTFTTERRIKQCLFCCMVFSGSYPPLIRMYNCEEHIEQLFSTNPNNTITTETWGTSMLEQTDTTIKLKNISSVQRKYKLLAWF